MGLCVLRNRTWWQAIWETVVFVLLLVASFAVVFLLVAVFMRFGGDIDAGMERAMDATEAWIRGGV